MTDGFAHGCAFLPVSSLTREAVSICHAISDARMFAGVGATVGAADVLGRPTFAASAIMSIELKIAAAGSDNSSEKWNVLAVFVDDGTSSLSVYNQGANVLTLPVRAVIWRAKGQYQSEVCLRVDMCWLYNAEKRLKAVHALMWRVHEQPGVAVLSSGFGAQDPARSLRSHMRPNEGNVYSSASRHCAEGALINGM
eukprot:IDg20517t1